jgi:hypothetical protein
MNRLYYFWTQSGEGAVYQQPPVLAVSPEEARAKIEPTLTSWDGVLKGWTFDHDLVPRMVYDWSRFNEVP